MTDSEQPVPYWLYSLLGLPILWVAWRFVPTFDGLYGQDSFAYYSFAVDGLRPMLLRVDLWPPFFWPPGYPLLVAWTSYLTGPQPFAGQLVNIVAGASVPMLVALYAREVWPEERRVPLIAGLLVAGVGQFWQSSVVVMSDVASLAFGTLGMWMVARYGRDPRTGTLLIAAAAMSYATVSRWAYPLVAIPCTLYTLLIMSRLPRPTALRHILYAALMVMAILSPVWVALLQQRMFDPPGVNAYIGDLQQYGWHPANELRRVHVTNDGLLRYGLPNGLYYATAAAHPVYFGPLLALFGLPGFWLAWQRRTRESVLLLLAWIGIVIFFHVGAPHQNFRFNLVYLPPAALLVAIGIMGVSRWLTPRLRPLLLLLVAAGFVWMGFAGYTNLERFIGRHNANREAARWVTAQMPSTATLIAFDITLTLKHISTLDVRETFNLTTDDLAQLATEADELYLVLNVERIQPQWEGRRPYENYRWLREHVGLEPVGEQAGYTLFRVGGNDP